MTVGSLFRNTSRNITLHQPQPETHVLSIAANQEMTYTFTAEGTVAPLDNNGHLESDPDGNDTIIDNPDGTTTVEGLTGTLAVDDTSFYGDAWEITGNLLSLDLTPGPQENTVMEVFVDGYLVTEAEAIDIITPTANQNPTVSIANVHVGDGTVFAHAEADDPDGDIVAYEWTLSDAGGAEVATTTGQAVSFDLPSGGSYTLSVLVEDDAGATATATQGFEYTVPDPCANITCPEGTVCENGQCVPDDTGGGDEPAEDFPLWVLVVLILIGTYLVFSDEQEKNGSK